MKLKILVIFPFLDEIKISRIQIEKIVNSIIKEDILFIDDRYDDLLLNLIENQPRIKYIKHEYPLGFGACFNTAYNFAKDFNYDIILTLNTETDNYSDIISEMVNNLNYGYDIVTCSRILENYNYTKIPENFIEFTNILSGSINEITGYDLTDPLSMIKAYKINSISDMELTEFGHGIMLQLWIQSSYFNLNIIEIPCDSHENFSKTYDDVNNLDYFLSLIETEKYLFRRGINN